LDVNHEGWIKEIPKIRSFFQAFGDRVPNALYVQINALEKRLHIEEDEPPTHNKQLLLWVEQMRTLCKPEKIYWCNGSGLFFSIFVTANFL
jgi:GTP-dependent phosphoenolpyruvate carboxykinase